MCPVSAVQDRESRARAGRRESSWSVPRRETTEPRLEIGRQLDLEVQDALRIEPAAPETFTGAPIDGRCRPWRRGGNGDVRPGEHRKRAGRVVTNAGGG